ncbi:hypothetical protein D3C79_615180 [compost metagenome]
MAPSPGQDRQQPATGRHAAAAQPGLSGRSGLAHDRCHSAHPVPLVFLPSSPVGVDHSGANCRITTPRLRGILSADGDGCGAGDGRKRHDPAQYPHRLAPGAALWRALAAGAAGRVLDESALRSGQDAHLQCEGGRGTAADSPPDLALFRDLRHRPGQPVATGQRAGEPRTGHCPSHLSHQHGALFARHPGGQRLRLGRARCHPQATGNHPGSDAALASLQGPLLQLV